MRIKDLHPDLQNLALLRTYRFKPRNYNVLENDDILLLFLWNRTDEGYEFWNNVYKGKITNLDDY